MENFWIVAAVVGALVLGAAGAWLLREVWPWHALQRRRVLLVTSHDVTIEGILWAHRGPLMVLRSASVHVTPGNPATPVDGEMVIERDRIEWMQVIGPRSGMLT